MPRSENRPADALRSVELIVDFTRHAEGSVLACFGQTRVLCNATVEEKVPHYRKGTGEGWITAEYGMLPRSTHTRSDREAARGKQSGRTQEIQRLIGRALRAAVDLPALGERQIIVDCDVLQADGGTRTAAITGGYVALGLALGRMARLNVFKRNPLRAPVAAISVGIVRGTPVVDLDYAEDSTAEVDMNVVATAAGELIELQGTAERGTFSRDQLTRLLDLGLAGVRTLAEKQRAALDAALKVVTK